MKRKPTKGKNKKKTNGTVRLGTGPAEPEKRLDGRQTFIDVMIAENEDLHGAIMLEPREELDHAVIGVSMDMQNVIYSYEGLVECYERMFGDADDALESAIEWVDYNVVRGVGHMGERRPIIIRTPTI
jgi:hypothetical protein